MYLTYNFVLSWQNYDVDVSKTQAPNELSSLIIGILSLFYRANKMPRVTKISWPATDAHHEFNRQFIGDQNSTYCTQERTEI